MRLVGDDLTKMRQFPAVFKYIDGYLKYWSSEARQKYQLAAVR